MENQLQNGNRVWEDLLSELFRLNYEQQSRITAVEQKIYSALNKAPQQLEGLITLMFAHIMLGNRSKAKSMALRFGKSADLWHLFLSRFISRIF